MIRIDPESGPRLAAGLLAVILACASVLLALWALVSPWDRVVYDRLLRLQTRPAPEDVLIVAIDDESLSTLGRWPWSRAVHARLLERLTAAGVAAVGFDVLFVEPETDDASADERLARAMERNGRVALALAPVAVRGGGVAEALPLPRLARAAAGLGHVDFELDVDGICRRAYLRAGLGDAHWPALALAIRELVSGGSASGPAGTVPDPAAGLSDESTWRRAMPVMIPFAGPPGHFERVSYADVLNGTLPPGALRDRLVLIGATATGLGDQLAVPLSSNHQRMPGVEINANLLQALREARLIRAMPRVADLAATFLWVVIPVALLGWLSVRAGMLLLALAAAAGLLGSAALLLGPGLWQPPVAALVGLGLAAPVWSGWSLGTSRRRIERLNARIHDLSDFDPFTGLPNRSLFADRLQHALERAGTSPGHLAVVLISLDRCDALRGSLGESAWDGLMRQLADRVRLLKREGDLAARVGDGELAVLIPALRDERMAGYLAQSLRGVLEQPVDTPDGPVVVGASTGIALFPRDASDAAALMRAAQLAAQHARAEGGDRVESFSPRLDLGLGTRLRLEQDLRRALGAGELELHYQPEVDARDGRLVGFEALLRWNHPVRGRLLPGDFIPLAEATGLIRPIGDWAIRESCRQHGLWRSDGLASAKMSVNVSAAQLDQRDLHRRVADVLAETGIAPDQLELELTETALLRDLDSAARMLARLRELGVGIAIDDFGTGYSSLSYLRRLPVNRLKIDRSFVVDLAPHNRDEEIATAVIGLAHRLRLRVVAEGVESHYQWDLLRSHGCDELQGFFFGRPMPAREAALLLAGPQPS